MHEHRAIGKVLSFETREVLDESTGETHKGIWVTAYVSKTAEDVWEKVLEGVYSGFSIGGKIIQRAKASVKDKVVNFITKYSLIELSLVDNPANPLANVVTIMKVADGEIEGLVKNTTILNVQYNEKDGTVVLSDEEEVDGFTYVGWVEDVEGKGAAVKKMVDGFKKVNDPNSLSSRLNDVYDAYHQNYTDSGYVSEVYDDFILVRDGDDYYSVPYTRDSGGDIVFGEKREVEVSISITEKSADKPSQDNTVGASESSTLNEQTEGGAHMDKKHEEVEKAADATEKVDDVVEEATQEVEKAADVEEFEAEEFDVEKFTADLTEKISSAVSGALEKSAEANEEARASFEEALADIKKSVEEKVSSLEEKVTSLEGEVESLMGESAVKKSADVSPTDEDADDEEDESLWRGGFLGVGDLAKA